MCWVPVSSSITRYLEGPSTWPAVHFPWVPIPSDSTGLSLHFRFRKARDLVLLANSSYWAPYVPGLMADFWLCCVRRYSKVSKPKGVPGLQVSNQVSSWILLHEQIAVRSLYATWVSARLDFPKEIWWKRSSLCRGSKCGEFLWVPPLPDRLRVPLHDLVVI